MTVKKISVIKFLEGLEVHPIEQGAIEAMAYKSYSSALDFEFDKGGSAEDGDVFYNTTAGQVEIMLSGEWVPQNNMLVKVVNTLVSGGSLVLSLGKNEQALLIEGASSAITLSVTPFGVLAPVDGAEITLVGTSNTKNVTIAFSDVDYGCLINGDRTLERGNTLTLKYFKSLKRYIDIGANF